MGLRGKVRAVSATVAMAAAMLLGLSGCSFHRKVKALVLPPFTPVELAQVAEPEDPPMLEADEDEDLPPVPVAEGAVVPKHPKRKVTKVVVQTPPPPQQEAAPVAAPPTPTPAPAPVQVAAAGTEASNASVIGDLTPGGDQDPKAQKEASDLIAENERRLNGLSAETTRSQAPLVSNVRNFQKQAQQALRTGDAAGAKTLATKGKLLLDDLEKGAGI